MMGPRTGRCWRRMKEFLRSMAPWVIGVVFVWGIARLVGCWG